MTLLRMALFVALFAAIQTFLLSPAVAQSPPVNGIRPGEVRRHALRNVTAIVKPGQRIEKATILIEDGVITKVGAEVEIPTGTWVHERDGLTVTAGFIDPSLVVPSADAAAKASSAAGAHWSRRVTPQVSMADLPTVSASLRKEMRALGFTTAAAYPGQGIFRGSGSVLALSEKDEHVIAYRDRCGMFIGFEHGGRDGMGYPGSMMGSMALVRQTLHDARWHASLWEMYSENSAGLEAPLHSAALAALADASSAKQTVLFDASDESRISLAAKVAREFELRGQILGSGLEFRRLEEAVNAGQPFIVPVAFPAIPDVSTVHKARQMTLRELSTWEQAPTNIRRLLDRGVRVALTTHRLKKRDEFVPGLRRAMAQGLTEDEVIAALTTTPAELLGLEASLGSIKPGKAANLAVFDGPLFDRETKVREVWVDGRKVDVEPASSFPLSGEFVVEIAGTTVGHARLDADESLVEVRPLEQAGAEKTSPIKARKAIFTRHTLTFLLDGEPLGLPEGLARVTGAVSGTTIIGTIQLPDGVEKPCVLRSREEVVAAATAPATAAGTAPGTAPATAPGTAPASAPTTAAAEEENSNPLLEPVSAPLRQPLGEYGLSAPPLPQTVIVSNATIWTCGPAGIIEKGFLVVRDGKIEAVGAGDPPNVNGSDVERIDAGGKHVTPGLIDCHSHTGISNGINEGEQANTAEVRIADVIDPDDIDWYRELAGGLTAANQLHGSANPIGGQNSVVKLKWGRTASELPIEEAIGGIKFALGENVVRDRGRYPNTRMGVEQFLRDAFTAARDYAAARDRYDALDETRKSRETPPRRDLELDALVEILRGERLVHCHSYRQDEIVALLRIAEEFGFRIGTLQHILEGYKVGEAIAAHGAGASSFSDWWAYKMEVMDAIPYNGAILHDLDVVVSFNSDSDELARRMNTEASKAVRYGGVPRDEALWFVSINPAKQLRIDGRTGSLEVGKDGDFVIWSGDPLSTYSRCEQTWIEGARYFDLETDRLLREETARERTRLLDKALRASENEKARRRRERDEKEMKAGEAAPPPGPTSEGRPMPLLVRALESRQAALRELARRGIDPEQARPGDCGCGEVSSWLGSAAGRE